MAVITGDGTNEFLTGTGNPDTIDGLGGNHTISGLAGEDLLHGGADDDILSGGADNDTLSGGVGSDTLDGGGGGDQLNGVGGPGIDFASYASSTAGLTVDLTDLSRNTGDADGDLFLNIDGLIGSDYGDRLSGDGDNNIVYGGDGDDTLDLDRDRGSNTLYGGADLLSGGKGDDTLDGGVGADTLSGGDGADRLILDNGSDSAAGGDGGDTYVLSGPGAATATITEAEDDSGTDTVILDGLDPDFQLADHVQNLEIAYGGQAIKATGNAGDNRIFERAGNIDDNTLIGGDGADTLVATGGNDSLDGGDQSDVLSGGAGADTLDGGAGADTLDGGGGADTYDLTDGGTDRVTGTLAEMDGDTIDGFTADDVIAVTGASNIVSQSLTNGDLVVVVDADGLSGSADDVTITLTGVTDRLRMTGDQLSLSVPTNGADNLSGGAGSDTIDALDGNDLVSGFAGDDVLSGNDGADTLEGGDDNDVLYGGADGDLISGGDQNDVLSGGADADTLSGGDGADTLVGGGGADSLIGGAGDDLADYSASADTDGVTVHLDGTTGSGGDAQGDVLSAFEILVGSGHNDSLKGTTGNDTLRGGDGDDTLDDGGGVGVDRLEGGDGADRLIMTYGGDAIGGDGGDTYVLRAGGGTGDDLLKGGSGSDTLVGGAGNDTLAGGRGVDRFVFKAESGADVISDFKVGGGEVIDLVALNLGEGVAAGDGEVNAVGPVFADFKAASISENAEGHAVITLGEGHRITLIGVAGDDLTAANFAFV